MSSDGKHLYEFGPYRLNPALRLLSNNQTVIPLQPKAFELLLVLVENTDRVLLKDHLLEAVWPGTFVEESNLTQNIFLLRKALGEAKGVHRYIITVPGRGYRFAESVRVITASDNNHSHTEAAILDRPSPELKDPPANGNADIRGSHVLEEIQPPPSAETTPPAAVSAKTTRALWLRAAAALLAVGENY